MLRQIFSLFKNCLPILLYINCSLCAHSIVFIHIGPELPPHLSTTIAQARLFNETCPIYLIANERAIKKASPSLTSNSVSFIHCESLVPGIKHAEFQNHPDHETAAFGLFRYSSERFFFLEEFIRQYNLTDVFHLESDVMLYTDLYDLLPVFTKHYKGMIAALFENDSRCVPSFLYIPNIHPIEVLINFFPEYGRVDQSDMETLAIFKNQYLGQLIDYLPVVVPEYRLDHPLVSQTGVHTKKPELYSNHIDEFRAVFDGAALGIYLAGWDSRFHAKEKTQSGLIDNHSVFNPSFFKINWNIDDRGRKFPLISYRGKTVPIMNLHITNKSVIKNFLSANPR